MSLKRKIANSASRGENSARSATKQPIALSLFAPRIRGGGRNWARTSDLRLVEAALSQLSYTPGAKKVAAA
jgi:hypothetical protein